MAWYKMGADVEAGQLLDVGEDEQLYPWHGVVGCRTLGHAACDLAKGTFVWFDPDSAPSILKPGPGPGPERPETWRDRPAML